jgi:hypothetical protein
VRRARYCRIVSPGARVRLLREVADLERRRPPCHRPGIRLLEPAQDPEQGRLSDPVRADYADSRARLDAQRDVDEDGLAAVALADVREREHRASFL